MTERDDVLAEMVAQTRAVLVAAGLDPDNDDGTGRVVIAVGTPATATTPASWDHHRSTITTRDRAHHAARVLLAEPLPDPCRVWVVSAAAGVEAAVAGEPAAVRAEVAGWGVPAWLRAPVVAWRTRTQGGA